MPDFEPQPSKQDLLLLMGEFYAEFNTYPTTKPEQWVKPEEQAIVEMLVDILMETDLPQFSPIETTSTKNDAAVAKIGNIRQITALQGKLHPPELNNPDLNLSGEILKTAPWVNNIHAWMKILNYMNTIRGMQQSGTFEPETLFAVARELYKFTTLHQGITHLRGDMHIEQGKPFPETKMREAGTEGVNAGRFVTFGELQSQLAIVKEVFRKNEVGNSR